MPADTANPLAERPARNLAEYVEEKARQSPGQVALVSPDGSTLSHRELDARAGAIAGVAARFLCQALARQGA